MNPEPVQPNIVYYEKKPVSILEFRFEELKLAGISGFTKDTSFQHLHTVLHLPMQFKYNGKVKQYKLAADMPIIVTQNLKKHEMYNMMEFTIGSISENSDMVNNIWFDMKDFRESFIPGFCCTYGIQISTCRY